MTIHDDNSIYKYCWADILVEMCCIILRYMSYWSTRWQKLCVVPRVPLKQVKIPVSEICGQMVNASYVPLNTYNTIAFALYIFLCVFGATESTTTTHHFGTELVLL